MLKRALIIDSGIGGLSTVKALRSSLPSLSLIYLGDTVGFPYGEKSAAWVEQRLLTLVGQVLRSYHLDTVVVACNTASTVSLEALRDRFSLPIVGVVPAIKPAGQISRTRCIGLLATAATVQRDYVRNLIARFAPDCKVIRVGSPLLADMAEEKLRGGTVDLNLLADELSPLFHSQDPPVDTVVLGCTHYPLILDELRAVSPEDVQWLDPSPAIARRVAEVLEIKPGSSAPMATGTAYFTMTRDRDSLLNPTLMALGLSGPFTWEPVITTDLRKV